MHTMLNIKSTSGDIKTIRKFLIDGLEEEKRKIEYALKLTISAIEKFEEKFQISTPLFVKKFNRGEIEEDDETFEWWAETKLVKVLQEKLKTLANIEICQ